MSAPLPDPDRPADPTEAAYLEFVAAYSDALRAGRTPPRPDLPEPLAARFTRVRPLLHQLHTARPPAPAVTPPPAVGPGGRVGRYQLVKEVGRGGAGVVYLGHDPLLNRRVAVKLLHPALAGRAGSAARFRAEGAALARHQHPHIVPVYEAGEEQGTPYLVMPYIDGPDLRARVATGPLAPADAARLAEQVARAIDAAHAGGVLHRDLKPQNVLVAPDGTPRVTDFGLAAFIDAAPGLTASGELVGTPNYMAPEVVAGDAKGGTGGPPVDVYGLGTVLYECLTGRPPFAGSNVAATLLQVRFADPPPPRTINPEVPRDLDTICLACLYKEPGRRYPTAAAVADDLRRFLDGRPIQARPVGKVESVVRWARRHRPEAALAAALLVALVGGAAVSSYFAVQASARADREAAAADLARREKERSDLTAARLRYLEAVGRAEAGAVDAGLAGMAEALRTAPEGEAAADFRRAVAVSFAGWTRQLPVLKYAERVWTLDPDPKLELVPWASPLGPDAREFVAWAPGHRVEVRDLTSGRPGGAGWALSGDERPLVVDPAGGLLLTRSGTPDAGAVLRLRDVRTGDQVGVDCPAPPLDRHRAFPHLSSLVLAPDAVLACGHRSPPWDGPRRTFDLTTGTRRPLTLDDAGGPFFHLTRAADGRPLVVVSRESAADTPADRQAEFWDVAAGQPAALPVRLAGGLTDPYVSADGRTVLTIAGDRSGTNGDGTVRWWEAATGRLREQWRPERAPHHVALSADGKTLLACGHDRRMRLYDLHTGHQRGGDIPAGPPRNLFELGGVLPVPPVPLTLAGDGLVQAWETRHLQRQATAGSSLRTVRRAARAVVAVISPSGRRVLFNQAESGATGWLVDAATGLPLGPPVRQRNLQYATFSPDERRVVTAPHTYHLGGVVELHVLDAATGRPAGPPWVPPSYVLGLAASPDGRTVAAARVGGATLFDLDSGRATELKQKTCGASTAFHPTRPLLAVGYRNGWGGDESGTRLWDTATGEPVGPFHPAAIGVPQVWFVHDGRAVLTAGVGSREARLLDVESGQERALLSLPWPPTVLAARPADAVIAVTSAAGVVQLWDAVAGQPVGPPLAHSHPVTRLEFSPDGRLLAVATADRTVRLWDTATGLPVGPPLAHADDVLAVRFVPGGRLVTATSAGVVQHWPLPAAAPDDPAALDLWVQAATGLPAGGGDFDPANWAAWRHELAGRWPAGAAELDRLRAGPDPADWHDGRAREATATGNRFAERWHLSRLAALRPDDWRVHARLAAAGDEAAEATAKRLAPADQWADWQGHRDGR